MFSMIELECCIALEISEKDLRWCLLLYHTLIINLVFRFTTFLPDLKRLMMKRTMGPRGKYILEKVSHI